MHHQNTPQQFSTAFTTQLNPRLLYLFSQHAVEEEMLTPELVQAFIDLSDENTQLVEILDILEGELAESLKFGNILLRWWSEIPIPVKAIGTSILGYKFYTNYVGNNKKIDVPESNPVPIADISELFPIKPITHFKAIVLEDCIQYIPMSGPF